MAKSASFAILDVAPSAAPVRFIQELDNMAKARLPILCTALLFSQLGCASTDPLTGSSRNELISVQYGTVEAAQPVAMHPNYTAGSLSGGALGLLATHGHSTGSQVAGAAGGAALGAMVSKETAGSGIRFTVGLVSGSTVEIVTENNEIRVGDCVSVEQGKHANLRRVSSVMCNTPPSHSAYSSMHSANVAASSECEAAKQELLKASTSEQTDIAYKKMRALCEN